MKQQVIVGYKGHPKMVDPWHKFYAFVLWTSEISDNSASVSFLVRVYIFAPSEWCYSGWTNMKTISMLQLFLMNIWILINTWVSLICKQIFIHLSGRSRSTCHLLPLEWTGQAGHMSTKTLGCILHENSGCKGNCWRKRRWLKRAKIMLDHALHFW